MTLWAIYACTGAGGFVATWVVLRRKIETSGWKFFVFVLLPMSFVVSVLEEMIYVLVFPHFIAPKVQRTYWTRVVMVLRGEFVTNMVFYWFAIFMAKGVGFYESFRQKEITASRLQTELVGAQLRALRMQLNPHFLFNTMNGVSSLMREDTDAADRMLEQLSMLLRMTLDRGDTGEVSLREEIEFVQLYLEIQRTRFGDRVRYEIQIEPQILDSLIPTMILQPVVENAYQHGVAASSGRGQIWISAAAEGGRLKLGVRNTGEGLKPGSGKDRVRIGVANVRSRLQLHYEDRQSFVLRETEPGITEALMTLPLVSDSAAAKRNQGGMGA